MQPASSPPPAQSRSRGRFGTLGAFLRGLRSQLSPPLLASFALLAAAAIGVQAWTAVSLSRSAAQDSSSSTNRLIARSFAERLSLLPKEAGDKEITKALDELSRLNPSVRPYIVNENGIVAFSPPRLGSLKLPFVDRRLIGDVLKDPQHPTVVADDPHNLGRSAPISVAPVLVRGTRHFVYAVLSPVSSAKLPSLAGAKTWVWALLGAIVTTSVIAFVLLFVAHRRIHGLQSSVAALSHDLRAPLSSIQGYLETVLQRGEAIGSSDAQRFMSVALRSTRSATNMVNDLHHLSLIEASGQEVAMEKLSLVDLVMDSVAAVRPLAAEKSISLGWSIPPKIPLVLGNTALLERLARNLLENAIRYTPRSGAVEVVFDVLADSVRVTIVDSGVGIPKGEMGQVSKSFFRGSNTRSSTKGSGIGLAVCSSIAKLHGRELRILSREREGTAVMFEISQAEQAYY